MQEREPSKTEHSGGILSFNLQNYPALADVTSRIKNVQSEIKDCIKVIDPEILEEHINLGKDVASKLCLGWLSGTIIRKVSPSLMLMLGSGIAGAHYLKYRDVIGIDYDTLYDRAKVTCQSVWVKATAKEWTTREIACCTSLAFGLVWGLRRR